MKEAIDSCPNCGSDEGFYRTGRFSGKYQYNYSYDGSVIDNSQLHDSVRYRENKTPYCLSCNKKLPKTVKPRLI